MLEKAFAITDFTGKSGTSVEMIAPEGAGLDRLVALGVGEASSIDEYGWLKLGGTVFAQVRKPNEVSVVLDIAGVSVSAADAANVAAGILLRAYGFDKYKTKKDDADAKSEKKAAKFTILCADPAAAKKAFAEVEGVVNGVVLARDLVNEPANVLGPVEFAARANELEELGVEGRNPDREGDEEARHGRAARRRPGLCPPAAPRRHAVERRQSRRTSPSPSSARAWCSTPAAFRSSRPPAWKT